MERINKKGTLIHRIYTLAQVGILMIFLGSCTDIGDEIAGCFDNQACNFNADATLDDESCLYNDCAGVCGGVVVIDSCGFCGGSETSTENCVECPEGESLGCDANCASSGSETINDDCGVCGGDNSSCVNYSTEIQPIFNSNCTGCHGSSGGLNLSSYTDLMNGGNRGLSVIAGDNVNSLIIQKLRGSGPGSQMPMGETPLEESLISLIETWINEGTQNN